ncbi:putative phage portal protein [Wolbachia endosymbiont of Culex quinquefasciatus JHB]|nr:putative phage portal protein [Wolbachia endosymbiont of Culex quinquefasciatus JHB]
MESEHLDNKSNQTLANGNIIRSGIEFKPTWAKRSLLLI